MPVAGQQAAKTPDSRLGATSPGAGPFVCTQRLFLVLSTVPRITYSFHYSTQKKDTQLFTLQFPLYR